MWLQFYGNFLKLILLFSYVKKDLIDTGTETSYEQRHRLVDQYTPFY